MAREVGIDDLKDDIDPLYDIKFPDRTTLQSRIDVHDRWFLVVDGGHRLCALLLLWYSGYPHRDRFRYLTVVVLDHRKCFVKVALFIVDFILVLFLLTISYFV